MTDRNEEIKHNAITGSDAENFMRSNVGKFILDMSAKAELAALRKIRDIDEEDAVAIRKVKLEARAAVLAVRWLEEAIVIGKDCSYQIARSEEVKISGDH